MRLHELLKLGVVPVVNENDSVSVRELVGAFGDNDELSALLATAVKADWLLLLTDVDGFYVPNGKRPRLLRTSPQTHCRHGSACNGKGKLGTGGMRSKLRAAKLASEAGANVAIANGRQSCHSLGARAQDRNLFPAAAQKVLRWQLASERQVNP